MIYLFFAVGCQTVQIHKKNTFFCSVDTVTHIFVTWFFVNMKTESGSEHRFFVSETKTRNGTKQGVNTLILSTYHSLEVFLSLSSETQWLFLCKKYICNFFFIVVMT